MVVRTVLPVPQYLARIWPECDMIFCRPSSQNRQRTNGSKGMVKAMKKVALSELKDDFSKYLRIAEKEDVVITRHGKPAGILVGFASEDEWFEYQLENDPRFLERIERARRSLRNRKGVKLEEAAPPKQRRTER